MKKTYVFTAFEVGHAIITLLLSFIMFVLLILEVIPVSFDKSTGLEVAIMVMLGMVFYFAYVLTQWIFSLYMVIELIFVRFSLKRKKNLKKIFYVGIVMKVMFLLVAISVIVFVFLFNFASAGLLALFLLALRLPLIAAEFLHVKKLKEESMPPPDFTQ